MNDEFCGCFLGICVQPTKFRCMMYDGTDTRTPIVQKKKHTLCVHESYYPSTCFQIVPM